jgi:hypothetical protein
MASPVPSQSLQAPGIAAPPATGYFVDQKKGEVNELKQVHSVIKVSPVLLYMPLTILYPTILMSAFERHKC